MERFAGRLMLAWGVLAFALAGVVLSLGPSATGGWGGGSEGGAGGEEPSGPVARVTGKVQIEALEELGDEADPQQLSDGDASPVSLRDPDGPCTVHVWQEGKPVAEPVTCGKDGAFEITLEPDISGEVAVEVLVPGRLRALELVEASPEQPADVGTLALGLGFAVTGQVLDTRGQPVPGVEVQAMPSPNLGEPEPWRATSDAEGNFAFETLPVGPVDLQAVKPGYALSVVEAVAPEGGVLLLLDALIDLEGSVMAQADLRKGAKVRLEGSAVWPPIEQPLADDGSFSFERLPDGVYGVEVIVPAQQEGGPEYASVPLENVTPDLRVSLALVEAFRVPVKVQDAEGEPVPNARVTIGYSSIGMLQRMAQTDEEGHASMGPIVPGPYVLRADATGFLPSEPLEVDVRDANTEEQVLVLARPARIEGTVVDENGRPVPNADVLVDTEGLFVAGESSARARLFGLAMSGGTGSLGVTQGKVPDIPKLGEEELGVAGVLSDEEGRFVLDMLMPGTYRLRAIHGLHAGSPLERIELRSGEVRTGVELRLRAGALLTGVVRGTSGQPIPDAVIELPDGLRLWSDELGVFDAGFHAGEQEVIVRAPGYVPRRIPFEVGKTPLDLEIELEEADASLSGVIRDGNGQPIAGALVTVRLLDGLSPTELVETDSHGAFELQGLPPGGAELEVDHLDYVHTGAKLTLEKGRGVDTELSMEAGWTIPILVRQKVSGEPIAGAQIRAGRNTMYTDRNGKTALHKMQGRAIVIEIAASGWTPVSLEVKRPAEEAHSEEQLVELEQGGAIEGELTDERGEPVAGATIVIEDTRGEVLAQTTTRTGGAWRVDGLPEGDVVVKVTPPAGLAELLAPIREQSDVRRGEVTRGVQLRFDRL